MAFDLITNGSIEAFGRPSGGGDPIVQADRANARLVVTGTDAGTNADLSILQIKHKTTGTPAANFAASIDFFLDDATNVQVDAAALVAAWTVATHGSVSSQFQFVLVDAGTVVTPVKIDAVVGIEMTDAYNISVGTTTGTQIGTATSQKLGFYGKTPIACAVLATGASHTADDIITALQNLGLVKQS